MRRDFAVVFVVGLAFILGGAAVYHMVNGAGLTEAQRVAFVGQTMALYNAGALTRADAARIMAEAGCTVKDLDTWAALPEVAGRPVRAEVADPKDVPGGMRAERDPYYPGPGPDGLTWEEIQRLQMDAEAGPGPGRGGGGHD
jgi:hypothetical protein